MDNAEFSELIKHKEEKVRQNSARLRLRRDNEELRILERKLKNAYITKSLMLQIIERKEQREKEKLKISLENEQAQKLAEDAIKNEEKRLQNLEKEKVIMRQQLIEQIKAAQIEKSLQYKTFLKEKKLLDDIACKIQEEVLEEIKEKLRKKYELRADLENLIALQRNYIKQRKIESEEENIRLKNYWKEKDEEVIKENEAKQLKKYDWEKIQERLGNEIASIQSEKQKRDEILLDLKIQELNEKEELKLKAELERQLRKQIRYRLELELQSEKVKQQKLLEKEEEDRLYHEQLEFLAERDKIEQMSNEKKRRKILEHRKAVREFLEERRKLKAKEIENVINEHEKEKQDENRRLQLIEEERINLLKEHAEALIGYLPPGVLKENDKKFLNIFN